MNRKKIYSVALTFLCILAGGWLCFGIIRLYLTGKVFREADPLAVIFTPENLGGLFMSVLPVICLVAVLAVAGRVFGLWDDEHIRKNPAAGRGMTNGADEKVWPAGKTSPSPTRTDRIVRAVLLSAAVIMILAGIQNGSMHDVLVKAVNLCTECVGLG